MKQTSIATPYRTPVARDSQRIAASWHAAVRRAIAYLGMSLGAAVLATGAVVATYSQAYGEAGFGIATLLAAAGAACAVQAVTRALSERRVLFGLGLLGTNGLMALLGVVVTLSFRSKLLREPHADPVPPVAGRVWSVQYSRHGGIAGVSLDMSMADDGRTRVRVPDPSRIVRESTAAPQRVAEISTLLLKMIRAGELAPKPWFGPFHDCRGASDCQSVDLTVSYGGKKYTFGPLGGELYIYLLGSLERAAELIEYPGAKGQP